MAPGTQIHASTSAPWTQIRALTFCFEAVFGGEGHSVLRVNFPFVEAVGTKNTQNRASTSEKALKMPHESERNLLNGGVTAYIICSV